MWTMIWAPLAVLAMASLVGWGLVRWGSRGAALGLVLGLVVLAVGLMVAAMLVEGLDGMSYAVWVSVVILPAAIGTAIGAMLAMRGR